MYADDLVIMSPSVAGLYKLIHICESFGLSHDVFLFFNKKSTIMSFRAGNLKDAQLHLYTLNGDVHLTDLIRTMLENTRFFVVLNGTKSRWRRQRNGLPQGSVLAPMLFNIYTNDQPVHADTRSFIYADDLCIASQGNDFNNIEVSLTSALSTMTTYYDTMRTLQRHRCVPST